MLCKWWGGGLSLVGAYYLHPPEARAIFLHDDLLCNGTRSVTEGSITYWGGGGCRNGKDPIATEFSTTPNVCSNGHFAAHKIIRKQRSMFLAKFVAFWLTRILQARLIRRVLAVVNEELDI